MLNNRGKNIMITNVNAGKRMNETTFSANCAIVAKETTNKEGIKSTTFVEFPHLKDRNAKDVFKCVILGLLSDESIVAEMKSNYSALNDEAGKKVEFGLQEGDFAAAFKAQRETEKKALFTPPTFRRLIANFTTDYNIGYTDNAGKFHAVHTVLPAEKKNLRALLMVNAAKIMEFEAANSATRRAIVNTLANASIKALTQEGDYNDRYNSTAKDEAAKPSKKQAAKKAEKVEAEPVEA